MIYITLKVNVFSIGKELYESVLILEKLWLMLFVIWLFHLKQKKIINLLLAA